ncbi:hemolysin family protein [Paenibacillus hodogayensis]|uniref:Hemolysin family protein n=1 Tax=Paenibacillus hodogayensis TaxID=279208 RepID=A0ABV5W262_9BACL
MITLNLLLVALLIAATAFFVATEFAIVKLRPSRVDQMVQENRKNAGAVKKVTANLDGYLSACQLGITITALGLGWLGEPTVEKMLHPLLEPLHMPEEVVSFLSFFVAFVLMTYVHVVLGELAPKTAAIHKAEAIALLTAKPIMFFYKMMYPFIWVLNGSANSLIRLFGMKPAKEHEEAHSEEELRIILTESYESGKINNTEYGYVNRIFAFDDMLAREIMVPRTDMVCLYADQTTEQNLKVIKEEQYTRFPVAGGSKDEIVGMINTKQFFLRHDDNPDIELSELILPVVRVPDTLPIKALLLRMQQERVHMVVLMDEYGGTSGMITIEDILEEIVGEIRDEFDGEEKQEIEKLDDNRFVVDGKLSVMRINELFDTHIESEGAETIGGWLYGQRAELKKDDEWHIGNLTFIVRDKERHRIRKVEIIHDEQSGDATAENSTGLKERTDGNDSADV